MVYVILCSDIVVAVDLVYIYILLRIVWPQPFTRSLCIHIHVHIYPYLEQNDEIHWEIIYIIYRDMYMNG